MKVLGLDTSTEAISVAVLDVPRHEVRPGLDDVHGGEVLAARREIAPHRHGELLTGLVGATLAAASLTATDLEAVVVGLGPGPFTGLRVGIVTAASIGDALGVPVYGQGSLDVLARVAVRAGVHDPAAGRRDVLVVTPARRDRVYWARWSPSAHEQLDPPAIDRPADVAARFAPADTVVAGIAARTTYREVFAGFDSLAADYPDAAVLVGRTLHKVATGEPSDGLGPLYLRAPDAVPPAAMVAASRTPS